MISSDEIDITVAMSHLMQHIVNLAGYKDLVMPIPVFNAIVAGSHLGNKLAGFWFDY